MMDHMFVIHVELQILIKHNHDLRHVMLKNFHDLTTLLLWFVS